MGFIDKVKGFFYDEEEIEEEVEVPVKKQVPKKKPVIVDEKEEKEVSERELFKAERTFNFPMDMDDDEPDFTPVEMDLKEEPKIENKEVQKVVKSSYKPYSAPKQEVKEEKKFVPTPIISPIYGIIDGEYKQNIEEDSNDPIKELGSTKKIDFDAVREKAYGKVKIDAEEEFEDEKNNENKGIFFNLVDEEKETVPESDEEDDSDDIKITYNDVDYEDEEEDDEEEDIEVPKITRLKRTKKTSNEEPSDEDDSILSETKEQDLFNLIDNMYNSEEEEDDE